MSKFYYEVATNKVTDHWAYLSQMRMFTIKPVAFPPSFDDMFLSTATAETVDIVSDDPQDTLTGNGAQLAVVVGLNENWVRIGEVIEMAGTTPVTTANTYWRLDSVRVVDAGQESNIGTISVTSTDTSFDYGNVLPGEGQSFFPTYTTSAGRTSSVVEARAFAYYGRRGTDPIEIRAYTRAPAFNGGAWIYDFVGVLTPENPALIIPYMVPTQQRELTDYAVVAICETNNIPVRLEATVIEETIGRYTFMPEPTR
jgi:hypothetical protein